MVTNYQLPIWPYQFWQYQLSIPIPKYQLTANHNAHAPILLRPENANRVVMTISAYFETAIQGVGLFIPLGLGPAQRLRTCLEKLNADSCHRHCSLFSNCHPWTLPSYSLRLRKTWASCPPPTCREAKPKPKALASPLTFEQRVGSRSR